MIKIYPHNTLLGIALHHHDTAQKSEDGRTLNCYSCLIFLVFSMEAIINYIGNE